MGFKKKVKNNTAAYRQIKKSIISLILSFAITGNIAAGGMMILADEIDSAAEETSQAVILNDPDKAYDFSASAVDGTDESELFLSPQIPEPAETSYFFSDTERIQTAPSALEIESSEETVKETPPKTEAENKVFDPLLNETEEAKISSQGESDETPENISGKVSGETREDSKSGETETASETFDPNNSEINAEKSSADNSKDKPTAERFENKIKGETSEESETASGSEDKGSEASSEESETASSSEEKGSEASSEKSETDPSSEEKGSEASSEESETAPSSEEKGSEASSEKSETAPSSEEKGSEARSEKSETAPSSEEKGSEASSEKSETASGSEEKGNEASSEESETASGSVEKGSEASSEESETVPSSVEKGSEASSEESETAESSVEKGSEASSEESESVPSSEESETSLSESNEESESSETVFRYDVIEDEIRILGLKDDIWTESIVIPDTIVHEGKELPVTEIAADAFNQQNLSSAVLGKNLKTIGDRAFINNHLSEIIIPDSLRRIGSLAFADNKLKTLDLNRTEEVGDSAFQTNALSELSAPSLIKIGNAAFRANRLADVSLPDTLESFGEKVFSSNGRYVKIRTASEIVPKLEKNKDIYGHVIDPVSITVNCVDLRGREIRPPEVLGADLTVEDQVYASGVKVRIDAPKISGRIVNGMSYRWLTPPEENTVRFSYSTASIMVPEIKIRPEYDYNGKFHLILNQETNREFFLKYVRAFDGYGKELPPEKITVNPEILDTSKPGIYTVTYGAENDEGNVTLFDVRFQVETNLLNFELGNGWVLGDFAYSERSTISVFGFSEQGLQKYQDGNHDLILPHINPYLPDEKITTVEISAFEGLGELRSLTDYAGNIKTIYRAAFKNCGLESLDLPGLKHIAGEVFYQNKLERVNLPALKAVDSQAFYKCNLGHVTLPSLERVYKKGFYYAGIEKFEAVSLKKADEYAFFGNKLGDLDLPSLETAEEYAFHIAGIESLNAPKLEIVDNYAFKSNKLKELDLPSLKKAGYASFRSNLIEKVHLPELETIRSEMLGDNQIEYVGPDDLPKVKTLGAHSFSENPMKELYLPKFEKTTLNWASVKTPFSRRKTGNRTLGHPDYQNFVVIWTDTKPTPGNDITYLVNPVIMDVPAYTEQWVDDDFLWDEEGTGIISLSQKGLYKWVTAPSKSKMIFPAKAKRIHDMAFLNFRNTRIRHIAGENIEEIGRNAFRNTELRSISFPSVKIIRTSAFERANVKTWWGETMSVHIPNVEIIEGAAFVSSLVDGLTAPKLRLIGERAFVRNQIPFLDLPSAEEIGRQAFSNTQLSYLHARSGKIKYVNVPKLKTAKWHAFSYNKISRLNAPALESVEHGAFDDNQLQSIELPNIKRISDYAFQTNKIKIAYINPNVRWIHGEAFSDNLEEKTVLDVPGFEDGGSIPRESNTWIINPRQITVRYLDEDGNELKTPYQFYLSSSSPTLKPIPLQSYTPLNEEEVDPNALPEDQDEIIFTYRKIEEHPESGFEIYQYTSLETEGVEQYKEIGKNMLSRVYLSATGIETEIEDPRILIFYDPTCVDTAGFNLDKLKDIPLIKTKDIKLVQPGLIEIPLTGPLSGGTSVDIPLEWRFRQNVTPDNYKLLINASLYDGKTEVVNGNEVYVKGFYRKPFMTKHAAQDKGGDEALNSANSGMRNMGQLEVLKLKTPYQGRTHLYYVPAEKTKAVQFFFTYDNLRRLVSRVTVEDPLPSYVAYDGSGGTEVRRALFLPEENDPRWVLDEDSGVLSFDSGEINHTLKPGDQLPSLYLRFPDIISGTNVLNKASSVLYPDKQGPDEDVMEVSDDISIFTSFYDEPLPPGEEIRYRKRHMSLPLADQNGAYFFDTPEGRSKTIPFCLYINSNNNEIDFKKAVVTDYRLDPRLKFTGVSAGSSHEISVKVKAFEMKGSKPNPGIDRLIDLQTLELKNKERISFPEFEQEKIDYIQFIFPENYVLKGNYALIVETALRNPSVKHYTPRPLSSENEFFNHSFLSSTAYQKGTNKQAFSRESALDPSAGPMHQDYIDDFQYIPGNFFWPSADLVTVRDLKYAMGVSKKQTYSSDQHYYHGDSGRYRLSLEPRLLGDPSRSKGLQFVRAPLEKFCMIDVLPKGIDLIRVEMSSDFIKSGGRYRIDYDYEYREGVFLTAVIFEADVLKPGVFEIADLYTSIALDAKEGLLTNQVFLRWDNQEEVVPLGSKHQAMAHDEHRDWIKDTASLSVIKVHALLARKGIRRLGEPWNYDGIITASGEKFDYKLSIYNGTNEGRGEIKILDLLPQPGDYEIQTHTPKGGVGSKDERGSEFSNHYDFSRPILIYCQKADGSRRLVNDEFRLKYNADRSLAGMPQSRAEDAIAADGWKTSENYPAGEEVAGILIEAKEYIDPSKNFVLKPGESLDIILPMQAPVLEPDEHEEYPLLDKTAYNSFARKDDHSRRFLEPKKVWNRMAMPEIDICFTKYGRNADEGPDVKRPLAGAVFSLEKADGTVLSTAQAGADGKVIFRELDPSYDYRIREIEAPADYELSEFVLRISSEELASYAGEHLQDETIPPYELSDDKSDAFVNIRMIHGSVKLRKVLEIDGRLTETSIPYVHFSLKGTRNGKTIYEASGLTDSKGELGFSDLPYGHYVLEEHLRPGLSGYLPGEAIEFDITGKKQHYRFGLFDQETEDASLIEQKEPVSNSRLRLQLAKIAISEQDVKANLYEYMVGSKKLLDGYRFTLRDAETEKEIAVIGPTVNGMASYDGLLPEKVYSIQELSGPEIDSYFKDFNTYYFKFSRQGKLIELRQNADGSFSEAAMFYENRINFPNLEKPVRGKIYISKKDEAGEALGGAVFELYRVENEKETFLSRKTSGSDGVVLFDKLLPGYYTVYEKEAPAGFSPDPIWYQQGRKFVIPDSFPIEAEEADADYVYYVQHQELQNTEIKLLLLKVNWIRQNVLPYNAKRFVKMHPEKSYHIYRSGQLNHIYEALEGAEFALYDGEGRPVKDPESGKPIAVKSNREGVIELSPQLLKGDQWYELRETKAPDGYQNLHERFRFRPMDVLNDPEAKGVIRHAFSNPSVWGSIYLTKYVIEAEDGGSGLQILPPKLKEGITFELYRYENKGNTKSIVSVKETDANGFIEFNKLPEGRYQILEKENGAYTALEPIELELKSEDNVILPLSLSVNNGSLIDIPLKKTWSGEPLLSSVTVLLQRIRRDAEGRIQSYETVMKDGEACRLTLKASENWEGKFIELPLVDGKGRRIEYWVREEGLPANITSAVSGRNTGFEIHNTVGSVSVAVTKEWQGEPAKQVSVSLYDADDLTLPIRSIELSAENNWQGLFENLDKYKYDSGGRRVEIEYRILEDVPEAYEAVYEAIGHDPDEAAYSYKITNYKLVDIPVSKVWLGEGTTPTSVKVYLLRDQKLVSKNPQETGEAPFIQDKSDLDGIADLDDFVSLELTAEQNWQGVFEGLREADADGRIYHYTAVEKVPEGYISEVLETEDGLTVKNTKLIDLPVQKTFVGKPCERVKVHLLINGERAEGDGSELILSEACGWKGIFKNLPAADEYDRLIEYGVEEEAIEDYISEVIKQDDGSFLIRNEYVPPETTPEETPSETTPEETPSVTTPEETPSETTPLETTPEETPSETTPEETPSETTPEETPLETTPEETPSETTPEETPSETTPEETPSETTPEETPSVTTPEETPSETTPEETPSETTPEETPLETTPEETPSETTPEETPLETTPEETPSETRPEETPSETTPEETPSETTPEETPSVTTPEETPSETTPEETTSETRPEETTSETTVPEETAVKTTPEATRPSSSASESTGVPKVPETGEGSFMLLGLLCLAWAASAFVLKRRILNPKENPADKS